MRFVVESERIAGFDLPKGGEPGKPETWPKEWREHLNLASILKIAHNYVDVRIVNATLLGGHGEFHVRTGRLGLDLLAPEGSRVEGLLQKWNQRAARVFMQGRSSEKHLWKMHDELLCIRGFTTGNSRTARLMLNHLRVRCGFPWLVVHLEDRGGYFRRVDEYRRHVFVPRYVDRPAEH
jgi:hypothetical protein